MSTTPRPRRRSALPSSTLAVPLGALFYSIMLVAGGSAVLAGGECPSFVGQQFAAGNAPSSVASGDLDGDGDADLVVANYDSNNVSVLKNTGNGTFAAAVNYPAGNGAVSVALGDLDGDGDADLVVANDVSDNVSVLMNNGNGTLAAAVNYATGIRSYSVALGDLDGDGDADLTVANGGDDNVSVLKNNGNGTFVAAVNYPVGNFPICIALGDLDNDGDADMAVAMYLGNVVSVLKNNGNGTFAAATNYNTGSLPYSVALGDLDGDGDVDLAVAVASGSTVSVRKNNGDGTFAAAVQYAAGDGPRSVAVGDLDGDGDADLAVANGDSDNISVLLNNGNGTFATALNHAGGDLPIFVALGDLDNDGDADLAVANLLADDVSVLLNLDPFGDSDGDGTSNCEDGCPIDPDKTAPGLCGCGVPDADSDGDGIPDCDDSTPPVIVCPVGPIVQPTDACTPCEGAVVHFAVSATNDCIGAVSIDCTHNSGDFFPLGPTLVTCIATDQCGNESAPCSFVINITPKSQISVTVELAGSLPKTRCIHFVTDDCGTTLDQEITFVDDFPMDPNNPVRGTATIEVDCGPWTFLSAKDEQHTKYGASPLSISADCTRFDADTVISLLPGDTDHDSDVDINDVTWFVLTFGNLAADGGCAWDGTRDADFDNGGSIFAEDYSLLSPQWLTFTTSACTSPPAAPATFDRRTEVPIHELAPSRRGVDLVRDGVFNWRDVAAFERRLALPHTLSRTMRGQ